MTQELVGYIRQLGPKKLQLNISFKHFLELDQILAHDGLAYVRLTMDKAKVQEIIDDTRDVTSITGEKESVEEFGIPPHSTLEE